MKSKHKQETVFVTTVMVNYRSSSASYICFKKKKKKRQGGENFLMISTKLLRLWCCVFFPNICYLAGAKQREHLDTEGSETGGRWEICMSSCGATSGSGREGGHAYCQW